MPTVPWSSFSEAKSKIARYITGYYNIVRPFTFNDGLTPAEAEAIFESCLLTCEQNKLTTSPVTLGVLMKNKIHQSRPVDMLLRAYGGVRANSYDANNTLLAFSSPRGGSTWLGEILATIQGYNVLWEPLHLGSHPKAKAYGFGWQSYFGQDAVVDDRKREFFELLFSGRLLSSSLTKYTLSVKDLALFRGYIVKFVNANMLLPWLSEEFGLRSIFMIRHPCAVVASQMEFGAWSHLSKEKISVPDKIAEDFPHILSAFDKVTSYEECLAFQWAVQNYVPLENRSDKWLFTTYEEFVQDGACQLGRLFEYLQIQVPESALGQLNVPSAMTAKGSNVSKGKDRLSGWRSSLSTKQIDSVLSVAHSVGVDLYTDELMPSLASS
ncbi:MAG: sulfotransferase domain-containing protein [Pseudomonadales bacterium]|nr:sulfotransferase domain-containing protein [Pseudomonadales bacterium]